MSESNIKGSLYLIPATLGDESTIDYVIPESIKKIISNIDEFVVEDARSARRFIRNFNLKTPIQEIKFHLLNHHTDLTNIGSFLQSINKGKDIGIISEAGCPAVADPGSELVKLAHRKNIKVVPLAGPSSILLALMASGMNGQRFTFLGYLPINKNERIKKIKEIENNSHINNETQIFIETPYRNQQLLGDILNCCKPGTQLCLATDLTLATEFLSTKAIQDWKKNVPDINKRPTVFLIYKTF